MAQPKTPPAWSARFTSAINWQRVHSLGYIVVSTNDGLYGVNPTDGSIAWENKTYAALDPSKLEEVNGTEFLAITYKSRSNLFYSVASHYQSNRWKSSV